MKKLLFLSLVCTAVFSMSSCSEKFKIAAPYKPVTVVYGLLDMADTAHYIRIQKAFLDDTKSSVSMAQNADSNYFPSLSVVMKKINPSSGNVVHIDSLYRVDMTAEGYPKESGTFFSNVNYAYKFTALLDANYTYRLVVHNPTTGQTDSVVTQPINDRDTLVFTVDPLDNIITRQTVGLTFARSSENAVFDQVSGTYMVPSPPLSNPTEIFQGTLRFNWIDSNTNNSSDLTYQSADLALGTSISTKGSYSFSISNVSIYQFLKAKMGTAAQGHVRVMDKCDIIVYIGSPDLYTYYLTQQVAGIGLTGSTIEPNYTNLSTTNKNQVLGLLTSRGFRTGKIKIGAETVDSLTLNGTLSDAHIVVR